MGHLILKIAALYGNNVHCVMHIYTLSGKVIFFIICRFKEHVQSNHPRHFLSEEEFVQLRLELSKASLSGMVGDSGESQVAQEELPPGTEDLADPAKVKTSLPIL